MKKCTDLNFGEGSLYIESTLHFQDAGQLHILNDFDLIFWWRDDETSDTHPNRQQIPQHWHQETADTSKMRELESLLYLRKQKVI